MVTIACLSCKSLVLCCAGHSTHLALVTTARDIHHNYVRVFAPYEVNLRCAHSFFASKLICFVPERPQSNSIDSTHSRVANRSIIVSSTKRHCCLTKCHCL